MVPVDLRLLVRRLNGVCRQELEAAAGLALTRTHYNIDIEHWLRRLVEHPGSDVAMMLDQTGIDRGRLIARLDRTLDGLRSGNGRAPGFAPDVVALIKQAWLLASVETGATAIRSGHLLWAMLADELLAGRLGQASEDLSRLTTEGLKRDFAALTAGGAEAATSASGGPSPETAGAVPPQSGEALEQFTTDLTAQARAGKIDPILGRDEEIRNCIDILIRRRQNNPILAGEAGVGKTAVVEGFALRIVAGDVPPALKDVTLRALDLGLLQAGASMRGEFERRLRAVIDAVKASPRPIILFIDEAHTLVGAGAAPGSGDAANLLKPALARGELRTIAATTWAEYKKYFESDAALTRRFQVVKVDEPSEPAAVAMMRGLVPTLERYHKVRILDEAVVASVQLAARFIPARQLPDKSVSLLDTACARVAVSQTTQPGAIEDRQHRLDAIEAETAMLAREARTGSDAAARLTALSEERDALAGELATLTARWEQEKDLVARLGTLRAEIEDAEIEVAGGDARTTDRQAEFADATETLRTLQGEAPLVFPLVDAQAIAEVVQNWTGIPAGRLQSAQIRSALTLRTAMAERIIGQTHAIEAVAQAIVTARAGLTDPRKPLGVFLMVGPSGVGKTETALTLAELLYGGAQNLTTIAMTEFKEEHKVSLLMGSPPGYVGYGEGGLLTEAVRRRPYSVILLDEMEKAHPGVQDVFYQVFDKGQMRDGQGRDIDFKNTVIIMTSNAASDLIVKLCADPETMPDPAALAVALRPELGTFFKDAFLGRVTLVPYLPLGDDTLRRIVELQLERIRRRFADTQKATFDYDPALVETIAGRCTESASGARNVENILSRTLLPELSMRVLEHLAGGAPTPTDLDAGAMRVTLDIDGQSLTYQYGPQQSVAMQWPGTTSGVRVGFGANDPGEPSFVAVKGPWALFRFLAARSAQQTEGDAVNVTVRLGARTASFALQPATVDNPFGPSRMIGPNPLSGFRCPVSLVSGSAS